MTDNCKLTTPDMTIKTKKSKITSYIQTHVPEYNLTFSRDKQTNKNTDDSQLIKLRKIIQKPNELMELSKTLDETDKQLDNDNFTTHKYVTYSIVSSFTGTIIIIMAIAIVYVIRRNKSKNEKTIEVNINPMTKPRHIQEHSK